MLSPISYKCCNAEFYYVGKIPRILYVLAARRCSEAWFKNGFIHREPWEHLCRRHMRSTECPSSYFASSRLLVYNIMYRLFYSFLFYAVFSYLYASAARNALIRFHYVQLSVPLSQCLSRSAVPTWTHPQGGQDHHTHAAAETSYDRARSLAQKFYFCRHTTCSLDAQ